MRLVFGWNNFKIKSYRPKDLGLSESENSGFTIEARQSYFHLFWIPFFGLGKKWAIRKDNKLYELPEVYHKAVRPITHSLPTPWYTFLGPILLVAGGIGFAAYQKIDDISSSNRMKTHFAAEALALSDKINHISTKDFITLKDLQGHSDSKNLFLKVEKILPDSSVLCTIIEQQKDDYHENVMDAEYAYMEGAKFLPSVTLPKKSLLNSFPKEWKGPFTPITQDTFPFKNGITYGVTAIVRHFGPILQDRATGSYGMGISMNIDNVGWPAIVTSVKNIEGSIKWDTTTGAFTKYTNPISSTLIYLTGYNYNAGDHYKFSLELKDSASNIHTYIIEGKNMEKTITPIN